MTISWICCRPHWSCAHNTFLKGRWFSSIQLRALYLQVFDPPLKDCSPDDMDCTIRVIPSDLLDDITDAVL